MTISNHSLTIDHYINCDWNDSWVALNFGQSTFAIKFTLMHSAFKRTTAGWKLVHISFHEKRIGKNIVLIKSCQFTGNRFFGNFILIQTQNVDLRHDRDVTGMLTDVTAVIFEGCPFYNNNQ